MSNTILTHREDALATTNDIQFIRADFLATYFSKSTALEHLAVLIMAQSKSARTLESIHRELLKHDIDARLNQIDGALERLVDLRNLLIRTADGYDFNIRALPEVLSSARRLGDLIALRREIYKDFGDIAPETAALELRAQLW